MPVLLLVPASVATAASSGETDSGLPSGLELDTDFPFVTLGGGAAVTDSAGAEASEGEVVVRGFIDADPEDPPQTLGDYTVYSDPQIAPFLTCISDPPVGTWQDVASNLKVSDLASRGCDGSGVAVAVLDTGINLDHLTKILGWTPTFDSANSWTPPGATSTPGAFPVNHGTMCAFDALIAAPNATLLDFPILSAHSSSGGSVMSGTLSAALQAFSTIMSSWSSGAGSGDLSQYSGLVCTNSWGIFHPSWDFPPGHPGRYCDNPKHPFIRQLEAVSRSGIDVFFAAGNCGADCPDGRCQHRTTEAIMGASATVDAMSIAGCDNNNERVGYSSQGPSITGMYSMKPDITSYTHFLGSQAFGANKPDTGTSAACPVAAGCMAALRSKVSPRSPATPYMMYDHFRGQAITPTGQSSGWNADYGYGIVAPVGVADQFGLT